MISIICKKRVKTQTIIIMSPLGGNNNDLIIGLTLLEENKVIEIHQTTLSLIINTISKHINKVNFGLTQIQN